MCWTILQSQSCASEEACKSVGIEMCDGMQTCHKQYKSAAELDTHLSSYDHHHKKVGLLVLPTILNSGTVPRALSVFEVKR